MINKDLIDIINHGDAVAIIGSGISTDAGLPSWDDLLIRIAGEIDPTGDKIKNALLLKDEKRLPEAFDALALISTRDNIHARVSRIIEEVQKPSRHHIRISDWPFKLYITTNYDLLIERACCNPLIAIGNRGDELRKLSAGAKDIVWHMHGASALSPDISQIVVCKNDYNEIYPSSNIVEMLKTLTKGFRCVYIGFGFNDTDFIEVVRAVGRHAYSGRPNYAFLSYDSISSEERAFHKKLRDEYNIVVIPYHRSGNDHSELHDILDSYSSLLLRRSILDGCTPTGTPDYVPAAASLRVQSNLDLSELTASNPSLKQTLIGARLLAKIRENPSLTESYLIDSIAGSGISKQAAKHALDNTVNLGLVIIGTSVELSGAYKTKNDSAQGALDLLKDKFNTSIQLRLNGNKLADASNKRILSLISGFFEDLCREKGLGVAQNLVTSDSTQVARRNVALLSNLPKWLAICQSRDEAIVAIDLTTDILAHPSISEAEYMGILCQCYFGQHLIGASNRLSQIDLDLIAGTCYILDASVLVCLLAEGSQNNRFTQMLIRKLIDCGAYLVTTDLFVEEVFEHARWANQLVIRYTETSPEIIDAIRGVNDYRPNQFLLGYFLGSKQDPSFESYMARIFDYSKGRPIAEDAVRITIESFGIQIKSFDAWDGHVPSMFTERDALQAEITKRRIDRKSFKHPRQTLAEAEVVLLCDHLRKKTISPSGKAVTDAFFLSSTRVVDGLPNFPRRISLLPEGLAQWLASSESISPTHASMVFEQLLWEIAQNGIAFVDRLTLLRKFGGIVEAAQEELTSAIRDRREYLIEKYGADPAQAFAGMDPLELPRVSANVNNEILSKMQKELDSARTNEKKAQLEAKLTAKERAQLDKLRNKKAEQQRRAQLRHQANKGRAKKRKKKK